MQDIVLSHFQCRPWLEAWQAGDQQVKSSLDLGLTNSTLSISDLGIQMPGGEMMSWATVEEIVASENTCFAWRQGQLSKIRTYSNMLNRVYTLYPTARAPTMLVSGIPMHRIKGVDPHQDTLNKIKAIVPIRGAVLDTTTGLGYTAIEAARAAAHVTTVELDPTVLEICRQNPWSQSLFSSPNIEQRIGDAFDVVETLPGDEYSCVIHDPPTFSLAGHLYSAEFYVQLRRVLKGNGRLFHYIGDPSSRSGRNITRGVVNRLKEAGFRRVSPRQQAFGVVAYR